jgi:hypothetical protein
MVRRRRLLALVGGAVVAGLAGCAEQEAEFLVTDVRQIHQPGGRKSDYPEDILYRVSVENTGPQREEGRIELRLVYDPADGERETWSKAETISLSRGTATRREYIFEDVYETDNDIENYQLEAEIVQDETESATDG